MCPLLTTAILHSSLREIIICPDINNSNDSGGKLNKIVSIIRAEYICAFSNLVIFTLDPISADARNPMCNANTFLDRVY